MGKVLLECQALGRVEKPTPECTSLLVRFFSESKWQQHKNFHISKNRESPAKRDPSDKLSHSKSTFRIGRGFNPRPNRKPLF